MLQVPTQGIAQWVERWSFVSMGGGYGVEEAYYMHFKKEINYYDYTNCYIV